MDNVLNNDLKIRDYVEKDFAQVTDLWIKTDLDNPVRGDDAETIKRTLVHGGKFLVMELSTTRQIIGTSWMTCDGRRMLLHHFGILPEFQGRGLSKILLTESLHYVKKTGLQVKLEVHGSNLRAINLYKKSGFKLLAGYNIYIIRDISNM
jgi:[ribosomal protein S18]-alanine N-acetyltransferase